MSRRVMNKAQQQQQQHNSWLDDAPMPPPLPMYANEPFTQFASTSYAPQEQFNPQFPRGNNQMEPVNMPMMPPIRNLMSPASSMGLPSSHYAGNLSIKREEDTPFSVTKDVGQTYGGLKLEDMKPQLQQPQQMERSRMDVPRMAMQRPPERIIHVFSTSQDLPSKNIHKDGGWIECFFHDEYEKDQEPRATFTTMKDLFVIDGLLTPENFTDSPERFCLGKSVIQTNLTKLVRQIGKGVEIARDERGNVTLTNIGRSPVFVLCPDFAIGRGDEVDTVYRLVSTRDCRQALDRQMLIFDAVRFMNALRDSTAPVDLDKINMSCFTRLSFLKGFGKNYPTRPDITNCPLWVELKMLEPLNELDMKFRLLCPTLVT